MSEWNHIKFEDREYELFCRFLDIMEKTSLEVKRMNDLKEKELRNIGTKTINIKQI